MHSVKHSNSIVPHYKLIVISISKYIWKLEGVIKNIL